MPKLTRRQSLAGMLTALGGAGLAFARRAGVTAHDLRDAVASERVTRLKRGWYTGARLERPSDS